MSLFGGNPYRDGYDSGARNVKAGRLRRPKPSLLKAAASGGRFTDEWIKATTTATATVRGKLFAADSNPTVGRERL